MEKYKFIVKLGQIKDLIAKGQDEKAIELAETVDFKKVKNIEDLGGIAALFLKKGMLLKARECYLELYDRVANRNTVMQLINLALRLKRPGEAEKYLREYQKIDRNDFYGLIFRYNIDKLEGKPVQDLIPTLEKLKKKEYIEAWAYELAKLYHKAGEVEKCMAECDDLIVFFGEGEYVERAKALRDYYDINKRDEALYEFRMNELVDEALHDEEKWNELNRLFERIATPDSLKDFDRKKILEGCLEKAEPEAEEEATQLDKDAESLAMRALAKSFSREEIEAQADKTLGFQANEDELLYNWAREQKQQEIRAQVERLRTEGLRTDELDRGIAQLLADDAQAAQLNGPLARECAVDELQGLGYRHILETAEHLKAVTPDFVRETAEGLFDAAHAVPAVVHSGKGGTGGAEEEEEEE